MRIHNLAFGISIALAQAATVACGDAHASEHPPHHNVDVLKLDLNDQGVPIQDDEYSCALNSAFRVMLTDWKAMNVKEYPTFKKRGPKALQPDPAVIGDILERLNSELKKVGDTRLAPAGLVDDLKFRRNFFLNLAIAMLPRAGEAPEKLADYMNHYKKEKLATAGLPSGPDYHVATARSIEDLITWLNEGRKPILFLFNGNQEILPKFQNTVQLVSSTYWPDLIKVCPRVAPNMHAVTATGFDRHLKVVYYKDPNDGLEKQITFDDLKEQWLNMGPHSRWNFSNNVHLKALLEGVFGLKPGSMIVLGHHSPS